MSSLPKIETPPDAIRVLFPVAWNITYLSISICWHVMSSNHVSVNIPTCTLFNFKTSSNSAVLSVLSVLPKLCIFYSSTTGRWFLLLWVWLLILWFSLPFSGSQGRIRGFGERTWLMGLMGFSTVILLLVSIIFFILSKKH